MRVPKPTRSPASATQPRPKPWRIGAEPAKACQVKPAAMSPATNQARQSRSPGGSANRPCRMPLTPAIRPLAIRSHTLARPIKAPPAKAGRGVKLSIVMVFRQLFDPQSSTYTYLLADAASREAVLIDPVFEQARRDVALVEELGLRLSWTLETHLHADHITGAWLLKQRLGSRIAVSRASGAHGADRCLEPGEAIREQDFVGYMKNLGLAHPQQMDIAVPANMNCGKPQKTATLDPDWAPLTYTFAGIWEVQPHWLEEHLREVQIVDVREPAEFNGPLGHVPGASLIPLGRLLNDAARLSKEKPVVTVCRSGARSAQASVLLGKAGFGKVANLSGGMLRWRAQRFTVEGGSD